MMVGTAAARLELDEHWPAPEGVPVDEQTARAALRHLAAFDDDAARNAVLTSLWSAGLLERVIDDRNQITYTRRPARRAAVSADHGTTFGD